MGKIIINKTFTVENMAQVEDGNEYKDCTFFVTDVASERQFQKINQGKIHNCIVVYKQPSLASDIKPYVLAILNSAGKTIFKMTNGENGNYEETVDRLLCNNFYCENVSPPVYTYFFKMGDTQSVDFASFYNLSKLPTISFDSNINQNVDFAQIYDLEMPTERVEFKRFQFQITIRSAPVCDAVFQNTIIFDGEIQEGTAIASREAIILRKIQCAGTELRGGKTIVQKIEFKNGTLKFYKNGVETKVQFTTASSPSTKLLGDVEVDRVYGGRLLWT